MFNQNLTSTGLTTLTTSVPTAGPYVIEGKLLLPTLVNGGGASSCVVTVNQNSTPIYTGLAGAEGFFTNASAAAGDIFTIVTTSAAPADQPLNVIKMTVSMSSGEGG